MRCKLKKTTRLNSRGFVFIRQSTKLEAGLPDINGSFDFLLTGTGVHVAVGWANGAFSLNNQNYARHLKGIDTDDDAPVNGINFKASDSNPIYGNSNTVQPPAIQLIPQIKY